MKKKHVFHWTLLGPTVLFLFLFLILPLILLISVSFKNEDVYMNLLPGFTLSHFAKLFTSAIYLKAVLTTLWVSAVTTVISMVLAYPAAYLLVHAPNRWVRSMLYITLVSPLLTSVVVRTFAWIVILSQNGLLNQILLKANIIHKPIALLWNMKAVIIAFVQVLLPFAVMPIVTSMSEINSSIEKASMGLGAGKARTFFRVIFPLTIPGLISGMVIVFSLATGSYITPLLVGGGVQPLLSLMIYQQSLQVMDLPMAGVLSITLLIIVFAVIMALELILKRWEARLHA